MNPIFNVPAIGLVLSIFTVYVVEFVAVFSTLSSVVTVIVYVPSSVNVADVWLLKCADPFFNTVNVVNLGPLWESDPFTAV